MSRYGCGEGSGAARGAGGVEKDATRGDVEVCDGLWGKAPGTWRDSEDTVPVKELTEGVSLGRQRKSSRWVRELGCWGWRLAMFEVRFEVDLFG